MKDLITIRIILALDIELNSYFSAQLKLEKRQTLFQLYKWIRSQTEDSEWKRSEIFQKLFKKKWTKENDFLLRNELKILKDKLEFFYVQLKQEEYLEDLNNKIVVDFYKELKIADEFTSKYKKYTEHKVSEHEYNACLEYSFRYADFIRINTPNYQERTKLLSDNLDFFKQILFQFITQQNAKYSVLQSHALFQQKQHHNKQNSISFEYELLRVDTKLYQNELSNYYLAYANAYVNFDTSTIAMWENVYALLQTTTIKKNQNEYCLTLSNLATICSIRLDFHKADFYFKILFTTIDQKIISNNIVTALNYITNLNKLKKYSEAENQLQKSVQLFGTTIKKYSQYRTQEIVVACYLYDSKFLGKLLAIDFETLQPFERIFYRLFLCINFIKDEQFELAFIEIQNLQRSKLMNEIDPQFNLIADFFFCCIKHINTNNSTKNISSKGRKEIDIFIQKIINSNIPMLLNYAPYLWMKEQMNL